MEIAQFLRFTPRRLVALVMLGALVAGPVGAVMLQRPQRYRATAHVLLAPLVSPTAKDNEHVRVLDDFGAALAAPPVRDQVAAPTGLSADAVRSGLSYVAPNSGFLVQVSWTDTSADRARQVVGTASTAALRLLAHQNVDSATAVEDLADQQVQAALGPFQAYERANGPVDQLVAATNGQLALAADRSLRTGQEVPSLVARAQVQLAALVAAEPRYGDLSAALNTALNAASDAAGARMVAVAAEAGLDSASLVSVNVAVAPGHLGRAALAGFGAGAAVVLLAIVLLAVLELRTRADRGVLTAPAISALQPAGETGPRRRRVSAMFGDVAPEVLAVAGLSVLAVVVYLAALKGPALLGTGKTTLALATAVPLGLAAIALALTWFEGFLVFLLVIRSSLDTLHSSGVNGSSGATPAVAVGGVFIVAGGLWLAAQWRSGRWVKVSAVTWWLWAFALACLISVPTSVRISSSLLSTSKLVAGVLMFSVLEQYLGRRPERAKLIIGCLLVSFLVPAAVALRQWISGKGLASDNVDIGRVAGTFTHPSSLAKYLLLVLPIAILLLTRTKGVLRIALWAGVVAASGLLLLTYTRAAWAGAVFMLLYLGVRARRQILWMMLGGLLLIVVAVPSAASRLADLKAKPVAPGAPSNSLSWRITYWGQILPLVESKRVTGIGFDGVQYVTPEGLQPHNGFVQAYVETGVIGLVAIIGVVCSMAVALRRRLREAAPGWERMLALAAVAAAIGLLVEFPAENLLAETVIWWYAAAAMTYGLRSTGSLRRSSDTSLSKFDGPVSPAADTGARHGSERLAGATA